MSRRVRRIVRDNITRIPSFTNIKDAAKNTAVSAKDTVVSARDTVVSAKNTAVSIAKYGIYGHEYLNANEGDETDDIIGSAWIKVHDVAKIDKDKPKKIKKLMKKVGLNKYDQEKQKLTDDSDEKKKLITYIREKKYTEKFGIRVDKRVLNNKKIIIPYDNIDEDDFNVNNLKDELLNGLNSSYYDLNDYYIEIEDNDDDDTLNYYISTPIKRYQRYAIVKRRKVEDNKKTKKKLAKEEKKKKLYEKKSEANKLLDDIGNDILSDDNFPYLKLANAYFYIHPFNVLFYDKIIMYGLKWKKTDFNQGEFDSLENIEDYFIVNNDTSNFNLFETYFKEEYDKLLQQEQTEEIDLAGVEEIKNIVYDPKYFNDFKSKKFYYKYKDNDNEIYYLCKNSNLDYKYNHKSWVWDKKNIVLIILLIKMDFKIILIQ